MQGQGQGHHQSQQHQQHQQQPEATAARQGQHRSADMEKALALAAGAAAAAEPRYDPINPGESREKLEAIAQHMYGRTYGLLEAAEQMIVGDACMKALPLSASESNEADVRHHEHGADRGVTTLPSINTDQCQ